MTQNTPPTQDARAQNLTQTLPIQQELLNALELMEEFKSLLEQETTALKAADFDTVDALQEKKQDLAQRYHSRVLNLNKRRDEILATDENLKEQMVTARIGFTETITDNLRALEGVKHSSQRLIDKIVSAARDAVKKHPDYANKGFGKRRPISIAVDEKL